ncbi:MAG: FAD-dependent oxidoreductase [Thermaurantiacus tibetensis]|uniref:FAD-dependent oxidoreductase n=1 Tax=Thermaurantiacus tibetensis TaxID=2759035 RepID=UPI00188E59FF|nr:FAD-dependent monooxygenase [Thermaurantiacus tibetensis]
MTSACASVLSPDLPVEARARDCEVLVAGGGPVGAVALAALREAGVDALVVEAAPQLPEDLRASTFHPPTLEMLDRLGLLAELLPQGLKAPVYQYRVRATGEVLAFDLSELADVTPFPFRLQCEQWKLTRLVRSRFPDRVVMNRRVVHFTQDREGVTVHLEGPTAIETVRTRFLVAADGANSLIRKWLDVHFDGFTYPEKFLTLSTPEPLEQHFEGLAYVNYVSDPRWWHVMLRVPELWRVLVVADEDMPDSELLADRTKERVFDRLIGKADVETRHRTIYRVHQRVATRFDHGRVLLAGDAAHLNNPLGGLGMNSGIHDAMNLAEKLVAILKEGADPEELLPRYGRQRRQVTQTFIQEQTRRNKAMIEAEEEARRPVFDEMARTLADPEKRRAYMLRQAMFASLEEAAAIV